MHLYTCAMWGSSALDLAKMWYNLTEMWWKTHLNFKNSISPSALMHLYTCAMWGSSALDLANMLYNLTEMWWKTRLYFKNSISPVSPNTLLHVRYVGLFGSRFGQHVVRFDRDVVSPVSPNAPLHVCYMPHVRYMSTGFTRDTTQRDTTHRLHLLGGSIC